MMTMGIAVTGGGIMSIIITAVSITNNPKFAIISNLQFGITNNLLLFIISNQRLFTSSHLFNIINNHSIQAIAYACPGNLA
jgi:hypothetical protein